MKSLPSVVPLLWVKALTPSYINNIRFSIKFAPITEVEAKTYLKNRIRFEIRGGITEKNI